MSILNNQYAVRSCGIAGIASPESGFPVIAIALLDGVIDRTHPCFAGASIVHATLVQSNEIANHHATFIASMLVGRHRETLGLCRYARLISVPIIDEAYLKGTLPRRVVDQRIAEGILTAIAQGAAVIQLSSAVPAYVQNGFERTESAIAFATRQGVRVVLAVGNMPDLGTSRALTSLGCIPVAMADRFGFPYRAPSSPYFGASGLLAPGVNLRGAIPGGSFGDASGSSLAASFVTAAFTVLSARFLKAYSWDIWGALLFRGMASRSVFPPHVDVRMAFHRLAERI